LLEEGSREIEVSSPLVARSYRYFSFTNVGILSAANSAAGTASAVADTFAYDARDQMISTSQTANALGAAWYFDSAYDVLGRRTLMRDPGGARTSYGYDLADRLTSVTAPSGRIVGLAYDTAGRRTSVAYPNGLTTDAAFETPVASRRWPAHSISGP
jgi:YD repeat-containing protein